MRRRSLAPLAWCGVLVAWAPPRARAVETSAEAVAAKQWTSWGRAATADGTREAVEPLIYPGDTVFLQASTGKFLDVDGERLRARLKLQGPRQAFVLEKRESGAIRANDTVWLRAHTGRRIHVEGDTVRASSSHRGPYQALRLERKPGVLNPQALRSGERIFLRAHTGHHLEVLRQEAMARSERYGAQQAFVITKPTGSY